MQDWTRYSPGISASGTIGPNTATNAIAPVGWENYYLPRWNTIKGAAKPTSFNNPAPVADRSYDAVENVRVNRGAPTVGPREYLGGGGGGQGQGGYPGYGGGGGGGGGGGSSSNPWWMDMYQWRF